MGTLKEQKVMCVLGMHRSGTSSLAGSLEEAGVFLGDIQRKNPYNLKGNCENLKIMELHDDLLSSNGGSWDSPPELVIWSEKHKAKRNSILKDYENVPCWGFKDPRTLFTLEGWLEVLNEATFAGTFRNPLLVAQSLLSRNKMPIEAGLNLWLQYNKKLLEYYEKYDFPVLSFDLDPDIYKQKLKKLLARIGLKITLEKLGFYSPELRHTEVETNILISEEVRDVYENLKQVSL